MSKDKVVNMNEYFSLPNAGLKTYLGKVEKGNSEEYRTTFFRGKSTSQVLQEWMPHLQKLNNRWPSLVNFENDLASKVGPMSIQKPLKERLGDIDHYYEDILLSSKPVSRSAIAAVLREWVHVRGMQIRSQEETVRLMKKSTNSGSPYFVKRRSVVDKTVPNSVTMRGNICEMDLPFGKWLGAAVLGWRGQEGGPSDDDVKQRVVWMFPFAVNVSELQVYQPLIEQAQVHELVPAWISMEAVDHNITMMFDTKGEQDDVICTDFSKFDQHFGPVLQSAAKEILSGLLSKGSSQNWLEHVFPIKYNIPLIARWGRAYFGQHGMGSGSGGTNADETLVHRALQYEAAQSVNQKLNPYSQCLGDDGVLTFPGISTDIVMRSYTAHGLEMNADKQYVSKQDCVYLRRWHHKDYRVDGVCVGVYATARALGRLCEQERYYDPEDWGPRMVALRQLSILENIKYHPLREEFVEFCMKGDKYRLGVDIPGFLDNIGAIAKEATDLMPDFLGYTKSEMKGADVGINNWWIVQYLKQFKSHVKSK